MRPASPKFLASWVISSLLLSSAATAAPTITQWSLDIDGNQERVTLRWDQTGKYEVKQFAQAREVMVLLPGATYERALTSRLDVAQSRVLDRVRLQEVTLADGTQGVQLRMQFDHFANVSATPTDQGLVLSYEVPEARLAQATADTPQDELDSGPGLVLTDEQIALLGSGDFGSSRAPRTGAGQVTTTVVESPLTEFWVPPSIRTEVAAAGATADINSLALETKLNELVRRVDFKGTSLENVLRLISEEAELNLLVRPAALSGRTVTLRLRDVTLRQMLDAILKDNDLGYTIEEGGIVRIVPRDQVKSTVRETVTQTVAINWVNATDVATTLRPFVDPDDGKITVSAATNLLIIRDVPENLQRLMDLIYQMDQPEKQVLIEMRLVNMTESARREFGTRTGFTSESTDPRRIMDADGFVGTGASSMTSSINNTNGSTSSSGQSLGGFTSSQTFTGSNTANNSSTSSFADSFGLAPTTVGSAGLLGTTAEAFRLANRSNITVLGEQFDVDFEINAQEERGEAVTLANPTVLSLNNTQAIVEIKRQIPYVSATNSELGSVATISFKDIGTKIDILPRITNHGWVMMLIKPEQIIDTGERAQGVPITDERNVEASVIVRDEQTVAVGGLRQFEATSSESGVPYLLRVPVLSWLFKRQANGQNKTELYLFVTPHILKDPNPTPYQMAIYDKIDYNWDLPDYFFDEVTVRTSPNERADPSAKTPPAK